MAYTTGLPVITSPFQIKFGKGQAPNSTTPEFKSTVPEDYHWNNQDFAELAEANPALQYQYTPGLWDRIGNMFGFRTGEDKFRDEQYNRAVDYEGQLMQLDREEAYNSAEAQAQRMREAGINPNLAGGVEAGQASEFDNQAVQGQESNMDNQETFRQSLNLGISAITSGANLFLTGLTMANEQMKLFEGRAGLTKQMYDFVNDIVTNNENIGPYIGTNQTFADFVKNPKVRAIAPSMYEKRVLYNAFSDAVGNLTNRRNRASLQADLNENQIRAEQSDINYDVWSNPATQKLYRQFAEFNYEIMNSMKSYEAAYWKYASGAKKASFENNRYSFQTDYFKTASGSTWGEAANATWKAEKATAGIKEKINSSFENLISGIAKKAADPKASAIEKMMYTTMLKAAGDIFNTNLVNASVGFLGALGI